MQKKTKLNCWEVMDCGRGPDLPHKPGEKICPVATEQRLHGVHGGRRGGRACWIVAGTMCNGEPQGVFTEKYGNCKSCKFYIRVLKEEGHNFQLSMNLLKQLKGT